MTERGRSAEETPAGCRIHPTAIVDATAKLGSRIRVGPGCQIRENVAVGDGCSIRSAAVIDREAVLGAGTVVGERAFVGARTTTAPGSRIDPNEELEEGGRIETAAGTDEEKTGAGEIERLRDTAEPGIDRTATVDPTAEVDDTAAVLAGVPIGAGIKIRANVIVGPDTRIDHGTTIGPGVIIGSGVWIADDAVIGDSVVIERNAFVSSRVRLETGAEGAADPHPRARGSTRTHGNRRGRRHRQAHERRRRVFARGAGPGWGRMRHRTTRRDRRRRNDRRRVEVRGLQPGGEAGGDRRRSHPVRAGESRRRSEGAGWNIRECDKRSDARPRTTDPPAGLTGRGIAPTGPARIGSAITSRTGGGADGSASEPLLQTLMREFGTVATPILRPDPEHTWIWSDLHLGDHAMVDAWSRPFRNVTHMNREPLAEWRRRVRPGDTIICLGDVAHPDAWREHSRLQRDLAGCPGERMHFEPCPHRPRGGSRARVVPRGGGTASPLCLRGHRRPVQRRSAAPPRAFLLAFAGPSVGGAWSFGDQDLEVVAPLRGAPPNGLVVVLLVDEYRLGVLLA